MPWRHFVDDARRARRSARGNCRRVPDLARALARLVVGRGGPRDLAAIRDGLEPPRSSRGGSRAMADMPRGDRRRRRRRCAGRSPRSRRSSKRRLPTSCPPSSATAVSCAPAIDAALDEARALRDESRRVIAALQARYAEETGVARSKVRHNNVLGYFVEVTRAARRQADDSRRSTPPSSIARRWPGRCASPPPNLASWKPRSSAPPTARSASSWKFSSGSPRMVTAASEADQGTPPKRLPCSTSPQRSATLARRARLCAAGDRCLARFDDRRRAPSGGRAGAGARRRRRSSPTTATSRRPRGRQSRPHLARHRAQHGRQIDLPAPECADRRAGADGLLRAGATAPISASIDRLFSRVGAADDLARGRSTFMVEMVETAAILNQAGERSLVILDEIGRGTATFDGLSIAWATIEHLHDVNRCRALFATHFHELTALAAKLAAAAQRHHAGEGVAGRGRVSARSRARRRRPQPTASRWQSSPALPAA